MMDQVDLDVAQARADLLPDKFDRRRASHALANRRLSSRHYKRPMSEGDLCSGWMLLLVVLWLLHHIHSKYWQSFKRRHPLLVCFISLPVALCWKVWTYFKLSDVLYDCYISLLETLCEYREVVSLLVDLYWKAGRNQWKEFMLSDAVSDATVMLGLYRELIYDLWLFLKRHCLTTEIHVMYIEPDKIRPRRVARSKVIKKPERHYRTTEVHIVYIEPEDVRSKVTQQPIIRVLYEVILCYETGWAWFRSLLTGPSHLVIHQLLIISGDVELNPGPGQQEIEKLLETVDNSTFGEQHWNTLTIECKSLSAEWTKVSRFLGLPFDVIDIIKRDHPNDSFDCWSEALKQWIKQNYNTATFGRPSWRTLLKAIAEVDKRLFERLAIKHSVAGGKSELDLPQQSSGKADDSEHEGVAQVKGEHASVGATAANTVKSKPRLTFRCLNLKSLTQDEKEQLHQKLYTELEDMMYKFQDLFSSTTDSLKQRKIPAKELARHLQCLGQIKPTDKDSVEPIFGRQVQELKKMESVDDAMSVVNNYCSFFNYRMLEHIINKLGTEQDKQNLAKYKEDFAKYGERHVFECPSEVGTMNETGQANMFVTLDDLFDNCNVNHLQSFVGNLQKVLGLSSDAVLKLCRIEFGSLKLVFQLPLSVQQDIFPLSPKQEALLAELHVLELSCGDYHFTRQENKEAEDPCASDRDSDYADSDAELASMAAGLTLRKPRDTFSITNSALGRSSYTGTTAVGTVASEDIWGRPDLEEPDVGMGHASSGRELRLASKRGDLVKVKRLTEVKQLNPLQEDKGGSNALHHAAWGGQLGVMKYFIEDRELNPASQCSGRYAGWTPLHFAAQYNHLELVQYLIAEQEVDPMCQTNSGDTPLHKACAGDNIDVVIYLVDAMTKYLPLKDVVGCRGRDGQTPLHVAALYGQLKIVKYFVTELNCDPNIVVTGEHHGRTTKCGGRIALHDAAQNGHLHVVKFLIKDQHCDPSHLDYKNRTPLHMAAGKGHLNVVKYLTMEQQCDTICTDKSNNTPLHWAASHGHLKLVKFFVEVFHCPTDIRGQLNMTPLEQACNEGHRHVVKYLESINY